MDDKTNKLLVVIILLLIVVILLFILKETGVIDSIREQKIKMEMWRERYKQLQNK